MNPITEFLSTLGFDPEDRLSVNHQPPGKNFTSSIYSARDVPVAVEHVADHSCWIGANPVAQTVTTGRGTAADVVALRNIYADLDMEPGKIPSWDLIDLVISDLSDMLETVPTAVVMSGHGKQPRWAIEDGNFRTEDDRDRAAAASRRFGKLVQRTARARGGVADSVHDLSRVLRAPGTLNTKNPDDPILATAVCPGGWALTLEHVEEVLDRYGIEDETPVAVAVVTTTDPADWPWHHEYATQIALPAAARRVASTTENRNNTLNNQVLSLAGIAAHDATLIPRADVYTAMARACSENRLLDDDGIAAFEATFDSAWTAGLTKPRRNWPPEKRRQGADFPLRTWDDFGNAARLVDHNPDRLLWIPQAEKWAVFDGQKWEIDTTAAAQRLAQQTIDNMVTVEAPQITDPDLREAFVKWAKTQRSLRRVKDMLGTARGLADMSARLTDFDLDPMLLNCRNGVLDLETLHLQPWAAGYRQMQQAGAEYHPTATAPRWEAFLEKMHPDPEVRAYLQRAIGYSLTGNTAEQKLFMHLGEGANGKSVFLEVMTGLFGTYGQSIPRTTLLVKKYDGIPNDIARMVGKRFLQTSETGKGQALDEETVKGLTGGEEQSARFMRQEFFDFKPTGKIHYVTNHFPRVSDAKSLWRRLVIIKWLTIIEDDDPERDHSLAAKILANELDGVLAWAVRGMVEWRLVGLSEPQTVRQWTREYKDEADDFGDFLTECTIVNPAAAFVATQRLHEAYVAWMDRGKRGAPMSVKSFSTAMKERGFAPARNMHHRGFAGLDVIPVWQGLPAAHPSWNQG